MNCKTHDGIDLYYELQGNVQAKETVVFLNGLTQSTAAWILFIPAFREKFKLVLLDFVFQGQSGKAANSRNFDLHARDVKTILDHIEVTKAHIVGISYGSLVAQHFGVLYPSYLEKLVLISTFAHKTPYYEAVELGWWRALEAGGYNLMLDIMLPSVLSENYFANPLIPINKIKSGRKDLNLSADAIFKLMQATKERKDYRKELQKIKAQTLIVQGEKDLLLPVHLAEEVHANIKDSKLVVIKNAGHTLNLEHFDEVIKLILGFLS